MDMTGTTFLSNYTALSVLFVVSYIFLFRRSLFGTAQLATFTALLRSLLTLLVIAHTVYTLQFLLSPPINLFTLLDLPLTAPVSAIRVALFEKRPAFAVGSQTKIAPDVETLLSRLSSFDARVIYIKYGPYPLSHCAPCVHHSDFALFALAPTVLPYLRTLILVSMITSRPAHRPAWRTPALVVLAAAFFAEVWWTVDGGVEFRDGKVNGWTHTHTYIARTTLLFLLPLFIHHLPAHSSLSPLPPFIAIPGSLPRPSFPHEASDFHLANANVAAQTPNRPHRASGAPSTPASSSSSPVPGPSTVLPNHNPSNTSSIPVNGTPNANNGNHHVPLPSTPFSTLNNTLSSLSATLGALRVLEWARLAGMRRGEVREKMNEYYGTADRNAVYARKDATLRQEAERLGMGYGEPEPEKERGDHSEGAARDGGKVRWPQAGGSAGTWRGGRDPRGMDDGGAVFEDEEDEDEKRGDGTRQQREAAEEREKREEEEELARSPLRAKARRAAREMSQIYLTRMGAGNGDARRGTGTGTR